LRRLLGLGSSRHSPTRSEPVDNKSVNAPIASCVFHDAITLSRNGMDKEKNHYAFADAMTQYSYLLPKTSSHPFADSFLEKVGQKAKNPY